MVKKLYSSAMATSAMTAFSYVLSFLSGNNFKEPVLLNQLIYRIVAWRRIKSGRITGWLIHYAVGLLFTEMYYPFWRKSSLNSKVNTGLIFGGLAGLAAILVWKFTLTVHPFPPAIHFAFFSLNLFLGHIIFGIVTSLTVP